MKLPLLDRLIGVLIQRVLLARMGLTEDLQRRVDEAVAAWDAEHPQPQED